MSWPACQGTGCGKPATCYGRYNDDVGGDDRPMTEPSYACDDCCSHCNEDGWCEPIVAPSESPEQDEPDTEPGPNGRDLICSCCGGVAFYTCFTDGEGEPTCVKRMRELAEDARIFGSRFKAVPFPKPLAVSIADYVRSMPA